MSARPNPEVTAPEGRLDSWKEIAAYLGRSERTVRRWEEKEGLPVHRLQHEKRGSVYGYKSELDAWRASKTQVVELDAPEPESGPVTQARPRRRWMIAGALLLAVSSAAWWMQHSARPPAPHKPSPEAIRMARKGSVFTHNVGRNPVRAGIGYYQEALRIDPAFDSAWFGLGTAYLAQTFFDEVPPAESMPRARAAARKALQLNPASLAPWNTLASISHFFDWDHTAADQQFRKIVDWNPRRPGPLSWYSEFLLDMRRFDEALTYSKRAQDAQPTWLEPVTVYGTIHYCSGHADLAVAEYQRVLQSEPNLGLTNLYLGRAYLAQGHFDQAVNQIRRGSELLGDVPFSLGDLGYALAAAGRRAEAQTLLDDLTGRSRRAYYPAMPIAEIHLGLGNTQLALNWLERAVEQRFTGFYMPSSDPVWDPVRAHPRFRALMHRMHLE